jgi:hypothetical protein
MNTKCMYDDAAENSIMQTITIAVSAILIASGLVTAPGLINNARDNNARTDLANIAYAEEMLMGTSGQYHASLTKEQSDSSGFWLGKQENIKYTLSGKVSSHKGLVCKDPNWHYLAKATSSSGKTFFRASGSSVTSTDITKLDVPSCITSLPEYADFVSASTVAPDTSPVVVPPVTTPGGTTPTTPAPEKPLVFASPASLDASGLGSYVNYKLSMKDEARAVTFAVAEDSTLPQGIELKQDTLQGRATQIGDHEFTIEATAGNVVASQDFNIKVNLYNGSPKASVTSKTTYTTISSDYAAEPTGSILATDVTANGAVYSVQNNALYKINAGSTTKQLVAGTPGVAGTSDGQGSEAQFEALRNAVSDTKGNVFVSDRNSIRKVTPDGYVTTVARFDATTVRAMNIGPDNLLYFTPQTIDGSTVHAIYRLNKDLSVERYAGSAATGNQNGSRLTATFNAPYGIDWDSQGNMLVVDTTNGLLRKITPAGTVSTVVAVGAYNIVIDSNDNAYLSGPYRVFKVTKSGAVTTVAGNSTSGNSNVIGGSSLGIAPFIDLDAQGNLYVTDSTNRVIRVIR